MPIHFGLTVREGKRGLKLSRDTYAIINNKNSLMPFEEITYADADGKFYTDDWCKKHFKDCMDNFDLNMNFFKLLDREKFEIEIQKFLNKFIKFNEISDLNHYDQKQGYYMMVLDEYCQIYIGTSTDIKLRVRQHWTRQKPFDRLLCPIGAVDTSIMSIDSFRAYDTTRIFINVTPDIFTREDKYISHFSPEYICNRLAGGQVTGGLLQAISMMKKRNLNSPILSQN